MGSQQPCSCSSAPRLIFPCSGASDVGAISDRTARLMTRDGIGKMYCLAGVGGRVLEIMANTDAAKALLAIDGCDKNCASECLEKAGFTGFVRVRVTDLGLKKGESPVTVDNVAKVVRHCTDRFRTTSLVEESRA